MDLIICNSFSLERKMTQQSDEGNPETWGLWLYEGMEGIKLEL
jgi:hypothetical protein